MEFLMQSCLLEQGAYSMVAVTNLYIISYSKEFHSSLVTVTIDTLCLKHRLNNVVTSTL